MKIKKYRILMIIGLIIIFCLIGILTYTKISKYKNQLEIIANKKYQEFISITLRENIELEEEYLEEYNSYVAKYFVVKEKGNLYKIANFPDLTKNLFTKKAIEKFLSKQQIIYEDKSYYLPSQQKISTNYYQNINIKINKIKNNSFKAEFISSFCESSNCNDTNKIVKSNFYFIKEKNNWKINEFEFLENEEVIFYE